MDIIEKEYNYKCFVFDYYGTLYDPGKSGENKFFDGVFELIQETSDNYLCALATRTPLSMVKLQLDSFGLLDCFSSIKSTELAHDKPDPTMFNEILFELGINPEDAIMIGDNISDLAFADNAGSNSILVNFSGHDTSPSMLEEAKKYTHYPVITSVDSLREFILG